MTTFQHTKNELETFMKDAKNAQRFAQKMYAQDTSQLDLKHAPLYAQFVRNILPIVQYKLEVENEKRYRKHQPQLTILDLHEQIHTDQMERYVTAIVKNMNFYMAYYTKHQTMIPDTNAEDYYGEEPLCMRTEDEFIYWLLTNTPIYTNSERPFKPYLGRIYDALLKDLSEMSIKDGNDANARFNAISDTITDYLNQ